MSTLGWVLISYYGKHTVRGTADKTAHELEQSSAAVMAAASGRFFPPEIEMIGEMLSLAGLPPATILDVLNSEASDKQIPITWNYGDVYSTFPANIRKRQFDASGLVQLLEERLAQQGHRYFMTTDACGFTNKLFVQLDDSYLEWARCTHNILLFDPTHGTNRYGMKLCCFTTVGPTGQTVVLACALLQYEDANDIEWAFRCFAESFKTAPFSVHTDGAASIEAALNAVCKAGDVWAGTLHRFCVFHLSKNLYQHIHPLFVNKPAVWRSVISLFWTLAKNSDISFRPDLDDSSWSSLLLRGEGFSDSPFKDAIVDLRSNGGEVKTFETEWKRLMDVVQTEGSGSTKEKGVAFLDRLYAKRFAWAACFTWSSVTWGINSTQRSEAIHSAIKKRKNLANFMMTRIIEFMIKYNIEARDRRTIDDVRRSMQQASKSASLPKFVRELGPRTRETDNGPQKLSTYGYELLMAQTAQAMQYEITPTTFSVDSCQVFRVVRDVGEDDCHIDLNENGEIESFHDDEDVGLRDSTRCRLTTVNSCTCQLLTSLCIPRRHMICLRIRRSDLPNQIGLMELIGDKWHFMDDVEAKAVLRSFLSKPRSVSNGVVRSRCTKAERRTLLLHEVESLIELGAESEESTFAILHALPGFLAGLNLGGATLDNSRNGDAPTEQVTEDSLDHANAPTSMQRDGNQLVKLMGHKWTVDPAAPTEVSLRPGHPDGAQYIGRSIAFKWDEKNKTTWIIGKIESQLEHSQDSDKAPILWCRMLARRSTMLHICSSAHTSHRQKLAEISRLDRGHY